MTAASSPNSSEPNPLDPIIAAYLEAVERGDKPDRDRLMLDHPQLASELRAFFADLDRVHQAAGKPADYDVTVIGMKEPTPGTILGGRYKLLENIGEGGMGSVWVAEQQQPVKRKVAIKLVKAGMDSKQVLARFEAERQALAVMDHPNIAKVFDGGMTDQGRPYFVMEYVKGIPFTEYCDRVKLSLKERLMLFIPVRHAVQHAHHKGIVHRDLKPSNILICLYDGKPVPKVIDFGLAKAMHQPLTEKSIHTGHGIMVGTPVYMSPEQAEHNNLDVDTRTDIYSLGVVLYELLVGTTPLERQQLQKAAFDEILRLIKEVEPPRPSVRISTSGSLPSIAAQRSIEPKDLRKSLTGDLDWIVMKSLDKERSRRYETANGFAQDIERFLNEEPVEACPPSRSYLLKKFVKKHRGQVISSALILFVIIGAFIAISLALRESKIQEQKAVASRKEADTLASTLKTEVVATKVQKEKADLRFIEGLLRPIGYSDHIGLPELLCFVEWGAISASDSDLKLKVLEMAFNDPNAAMRLARRSERAMQACVGLSPDRRESAHRILSKRQLDQNADPRIVAAACWLDLETGSCDIEVLERSLTLFLQKEYIYNDLVPFALAALRKCSATPSLRKVIFQQFMEISPARDGAWLQHKLARPLVRELMSQLTPSEKIVFAERMLAHLGPKQQRASDSYAAAAEVIRAAVPSMNQKQIIDAWKGVYRFYETSWDSEGLEAFEEVLLALSALLPPSEAEINWHTAVDSITRWSASEPRSGANFSKILDVFAGQLDADTALKCWLIWYDRFGDDSTDIQQREIAGIVLCSIAGHLNSVEKSQRSIDLVNMICDEPASTALTPIVSEIVVRIVPEISPALKSQIGQMMALQFDRNLDEKQVMAILRVLTLVAEQIDGESRQRIWNDLTMLLNKSKPWPASVSFHSRFFPDWELVYQFGDTLEALGATTSPDAAAIAWNELLGVLKVQTDSHFALNAAQGLAALTSQLPSERIASICDELCQIAQTPSQYSSSLAACRVLTALAERLDDKHADIASAIMATMCRKTQDGFVSQPFEAYARLNARLASPETKRRNIELVQTLLDDESRIPMSNIEGADMASDRRDPVNCFLGLLFDPRDLAKMLSHPNCTGSYREALLQRFEELVLHNGKDVFLTLPNSDAVEESSHSDAPEPLSPARRFNTVHDAAAWIQQNWPGFKLDETPEVQWRGRK